MNGFHLSLVSDYITAFGSWYVMRSHYMVNL